MTNFRTLDRIVWMLAVLLAGLSTAASRAADDDADDEPPEPITVSLRLEPRILDMDRLRASRMGYRPTNFTLQAEKPAAVGKEPDYNGTPGYGCFRIGDGPRNATLFVIDEPENGEDSRIFVDRNQNGDLTDDGPGAWDEVRMLEGVRSYRVVFPVRASWGTPLQEKEAADYLLFLYKRQGTRTGGYAKISGRAGELPIGDKTYSVVLGESTNDGLFTVPATGDLTRRPLEFCIDLDGDGTFQGVSTTKGGKEFRAPERFSLSDPFAIDGQWYLGRPSISGHEFTLIPTDPPKSGMPAGQAPVEVRPLLAAGTPAPDFEIEAANGGTIRLASLGGKIVILDFWATWCGPCQMAMPGLERIYRAVRDQGVEVLSVNVYDDRTTFLEWIKANSGTKYSFLFGRDPAEKGDPKSIAGAVYNVPGLPTMYVIDREGKVAAAIVGAGQDKALLETLADLGVDVPAEEEVAAD